MVLETYPASVPIFSHSAVDISTEPDVCNFLGDPLHGNWWSLFVPSFPYHILLAGEEVGCIGSAGWHWVRGRWEKMVFVKEFQPTCKRLC